MRSTLVAAALIAGVMVAGCEAKIGRDEAEPAAGGAPSAVGKSEDGSFSIEAPGFSMRFDLPRALTDHTSVDSDGDLIYPGSTLRGMHVQASGEGGAGVELRFATPDDPAKVARWYRDAARADRFTVDDVKEAAGAYVLTGRQTRRGDPFTIHLSAASGGGAEGRIGLLDRDRNRP